MSMLSASGGSVELEGAIKDDDYLLKPTRMIKKHKTNKLGNAEPTDSRNAADSYNNRKFVSSNQK